MSDFEVIKKAAEQESFKSREKAEAEETKKLITEQVENSKSNRKLREDFSKKFYVCIWTAFVF
ncbi:MAG: hypothetical protein GDA46_06685 [Bdellovibrionales bacterium]|nr:hypothetical protein [Bdellovibrionales bacterium]